MADGIPPWLNIDPVAPVGRLLEGYRAGLSASEAQTAAAQRAQSMAFAQAQASENARLRQEQHQLDVQRFGLELRLKEQQAEQAAQEAAIQLEGQQGLQKELAQGVPIQEAFVKWAPKLLYKHPERIAQAYRAFQTPAAPQPGWTPSGQEYMVDARGGLRFPPRPVAEQAAGGPITAQQVVDEQGRPLGMRAIRGSRGGVHPVKTSGLTPGERMRAQVARLATIKGLLEDAEPSEIDLLKKQRDAILKDLERLSAPPSDIAEEAPSQPTSGTDEEEE